MPGGSRTLWKQIKGRRLVRVYRGLPVNGVNLFGY